ncbi:hypothetical protein RhiirA4_479996 [Rhizophagus irregularis]|uniref:Uncharacterized protein n=1 Tax=Rhizophagus irregularis TaxID=588596 RepID=A0A2I1HHA0_9GLOM|nr:hypothetical protein RhiirA4_479996 [Rhizophagus irregularis]
MNMEIFEESKHQSLIITLTQKAKKPKQYDLEKGISTIITGYTSTNKENIQEIVIYDILAIQTQLDILNGFKDWDHVIVIKINTNRIMSNWEPIR